jgi:predicted  nucleic acid-binding Zn-ribbon protein
LALLNSKLINDYYRLFFNDKAIKRVQLQQLPIKEVSEDKQLELAELATEYMKLSKDFEDSSDGTERWNQLKEEIGVVNKKIDRLVYKIYNITEEEKKLIEGR